VTYFEEGRAAWFRECMHQEAGSTAYPVIVARIEIDYLAPVAFGNHVRIYTRCSRIGGKSLTIEGMIVVDEIPGRTAETMAAKYVCTVVYYDYKNGKTYLVPDTDRAKITAFEPVLDKQSK
ncbi:MAG: thioesterase family protein, partial [Bacteroidota bacterium]